MCIKGSAVARRGIKPQMFNDLAPFLSKQGRGLGDGYMLIEEGG